MLQLAYYERTAAKYDRLHLGLDSEHSIALHYISALVPPLSINSVLDVGCGTGRGIYHLRKVHPDLRVVGLERVENLLKVAITKGVPSSALVIGDGGLLPFRDASFDAVVEFGVLHHVPRPEVLVREMLRVAKTAVFISDSNIFGQGRPALRVMKFLLYKAGLWKFAKFVQTRGKGYSFSEGDGIAYSYSVYFQYPMLADWSDRIVVVPLSSDCRAARWRLHAFSAAGVLLGAVRDTASLRRDGSAAK
ncbi:MAG: class I SAM-dependent methyltransferase [Candidatus Binataceae bacterium]